MLATRPVVSHHPSTPERVNTAAANTKKQKRDGQSNSHRYHPYGRYTANTKYHYKYTAGANHSLNKLRPVYISITVTITITITIIHRYLTIIIVIRSTAIP